MRNKSKMIDEWMKQSVSALESVSATSRHAPITMNTISKSKRKLNFVNLLVKIFQQFEHR